VHDAPLTECLCDVVRVHKVLERLVASLPHSVSVRDKQPGVSLAHPRDIVTRCNDHRRAGVVEPSEVDEVALLTEENLSVRPLSFLCHLCVPRAVCGTKRRGCSKIERVCVCVCARARACARVRARVCVCVRVCVCT
jgi:hypothetical protein